MGRSPDYDIKVAVGYGPVLPNGRHQHTRWYSIGAAWMNPKNQIKLDIVTMPGVQLYLIPKSVDPFEDNERAISIEEDNF
jgi:hypothetical protein